MLQCRMRLPWPRVHAQAVDVGRSADLGRCDARGGVGLRGSTAAAQTAETASAALDVLRKSISVDVHTHGGTTGITSQAPPSADLATGMKAGSLAVACLADVPDAPLLGRDASGVLRALRPHALLVEDADLALGIGDRGGGAHDLRKPHVLAAVGHDRHPIAQDGAQRAEPLVQRRLEQAGERSEALLEKMGFVLNDERRHGVHEHFDPV